MSDTRPEYTLSAIARIVGGEVAGDGDVIIKGVASLEKAGSSDLSFVADKKYLPALEKSKAGAIVCTTDVKSPRNNLLYVKNPHLSFGMIVELFHPLDVAGTGIVHPTVVFGEDVQLGKTVSIGPYVTVGDRCALSEGVVIGSLVSIGNDVEIGEHTRIYPNVTIYDKTRIGMRCLIHAGVVLGGDGFGFARDDSGRHRKIPQIGGLVIGDDIEIGSNCTIDRGSVDNTVIARGAKFDNLVHVAHNVKIGEDSLLVAQVGVSGSTTIGKNVVLAGQAGVAGHLEIGDGGIIGGQAGVTKSVQPGEIVSGYPARPHKKTLKTQASLVKIPQMLERIKELEKKLRNLEKRLAEREKTRRKGPS
jgi:UDP-3-O-[3-hydroxymyristoyl] glucosamine N-acyltransferase